MPTEKIVVVAGATGRLGGIANALAARGHRVRALARDPESGAAALLRSAGAEVRYGDFDDPAGIARVARGADAVFATGTARTGSGRTASSGTVLGLPTPQPPRVSVSSSTSPATERPPTASCR